MKVTVARGGHMSGGQDPTLQREVFEQELVDQGQTTSIPLYIDLGIILRRQIPDNLLAGISLPQIVENLRQAGDFLFRQTEEIRVVLKPLGQKGEYFLFANSPDANHIFSSVQEYLQRKSLHFHVICHPILSVERNNGELQRVEETHQALEKESFIWLEIERLPERLVEDLVSGVKQILSAALPMPRSEAP